MESSLITPIFTLLGTLIGGLVTFAINRQQFKHQIKALHEEHKTEFMAETTARHFLGHKNYTDRSFDVLVKHLGGVPKEILDKAKNHISDAEALAAEQTKALEGIEAPADETK
jgi:hypothetical protein